MSRDIGLATLVVWIAPDEAHSTNRPRVALFMFAMFALPMAVRNDPLLYEWVMYRALHSLREMGFVGPSAYVTGYPGRHAAAGWAMQDETQTYFGYTVPTPEQMAASISLSALEAETLSQTTQRHIRPSAMWAETINDRLPEFERAVVSALVNLPQRPEALMFWTNCRAAKAAARVLGIPSIHNELGPLRAPWFRKTNYFDFEGVNGSTSAANRWAAFRAENADVPVLAREALLELLQTVAPRASPASRHRMGVALQVADDSNLIAFGNGYSSFDALATARRYCDDILARPHPAMVQKFQMPGVSWDESATPADFLTRIDHLVTVNSSMALEGMLRGVRVSVLGQSPFADGGWDLESGRPRLDDVERLRWLNWMIFAYLIPEANLFDPEYYRWRLTHPSESEIYLRNHHYWITTGSAYTAC